MAFRNFSASLFAFNQTVIDKTVCLILSKVVFNISPDRTDYINVYRQTVWHVFEQQHDTRAPFELETASGAGQHVKQRKGVYGLFKKICVGVV